MASENKKSKTNQKHHWGRGGKFLKITHKCKGVCFYNSSMRKQIKNFKDE